ncbi:LysE family translocator [Phaeobacter gallaeciensis]|uniref:Translocator protein, LysE family n=1 Tax=Phaeobacter gallaeciensis TaxID=60890 RepID=A0AAD0EBN0_9RHOB|nr:LysE family translocator [Phaeobacter gallaeciensis]AHD08162.1 Putative threonine efflux protein [Phaeobacter gallaeciensis DSM 26640]ATE91428.1 translocator protein, LysE family [Phaeobacter gallaeciensis]ATE95704.1 translocator protein, LysE family [Phaeobacter gallaeciensis]ATF00044.1 translocator protein, LysE family [Phaeobacter gallaeciensis]ATF04476.1 translocator protein, LysE family [Phaeobacter gallaeciensis]
MTYELFFALAGFVFGTVFTPGPNNLMLMASGANFGFRRSLPHLTGVAVGFPLMILPVGLGVMQLFDAFPALTWIMTALSVAYMLWLAWKVANAAPPRDGEAQGTPLSFLQACAFQWVNPKAWAMALGAITLYAASRDVTAILWVSGTYLLVGSFSASTWTLLGQQLRRLLTQPAQLRAFNWTMAALLLASLAAILLQR